MQGAHGLTHKTSQGHCRVTMHRAGGSTEKVHGVAARRLAAGVSSQRRAPDLNFGGVQINSVY